MDTEWPADADGDVFRSLAAQGFDFSKAWEIDFQIDFSDLITDEPIAVLQRAYPGAHIKKILDEAPPYVLLQLRSELTYDFVIRMQSRLSELIKPFGGWCESWGVLH
jgi:hypothetical protein